MTNEVQPTSLPEKKPSRIVKDIQRNPCGCVITEYGDGAKQLAPCVPCGLYSSAQSLRQAATAMAQAADAMAAVATTIQNASNQGLLDAVSKKAVSPLRPVP